MNSAFVGAVAMASLVAAMFFLRYWRDTGDRFFLLFAIAFLLDAIARFALASGPDEHEPLIYFGRLLTYGVILAAVIDKNMSAAHASRGRSGLTGSPGSHRSFEE